MSAVTTSTDSRYTLSFYPSISAGFPSPADDFLESKLDLNTYVVQHPSSTFYVRANGDSMTDAGISSGDVLVVVRSAIPKSGDIVVACVHGEFLVKRLRKEGGRYVLHSENNRLPMVRVVLGDDCRIWGVVSHAIHQF